MLVSALACGTGTAGCDQPGTASTGAGTTTGGIVVRHTASRPVTAKADTTWAAACPIPTDAPQAPIGHTAAALTKRYGSAAKDARFVLGEALDPVRMSVRTVLSAPDDLKRDIREMSWLAGECELTVWLAQRGGREVAVQTMRGPAAGEH
jgi:hypothetical protein